MDADTEGILVALLKSEAALRDAIRRAEPTREGDRKPMKDMQEALGLVAGGRMELEAGRWDGRTLSPPAYPESKGRQ